jgi:hypothetical protein
LGAGLVIPLVVAAFLADSHLIDDNLDFNLFSKSFASSHNLRDILILFAVDSLIEAGNQICGAENLFLSCDKGNKKGLSHFVKILSWWDKIEKKVQTFVLDIDASEGTSEGCAEAIQHSMKKVHNTIALLLKGQTTDSGGGCVFESLGKQSQKRGLCNATYLVASCTLHAIQIALANPVKKAKGEGSLGARTMMQMLHSAYDLQESMEFSEFRLVMDEAKQWIEQQQEQTDGLPANIYDPKIKDFLVNTWNRVNEFALPQGESDELPDKIQKIPQPVLTRWWYVGVAAAFLKQYCRIVLRATQIIINLNDSKSRPNKIASGLQFIMKEDIAYSDMLFLAQFHTGFPIQHFKWLQEEDEVAKNPGLLPTNPGPILSYGERSHSVFNRNSFGDYHKNVLEKLSDEKKGKQKRNSEAFIEEAITSFGNHYLRWCNELLPATLGGEAPPAKVVARILLHHHLPDNPNKQSQIDTAYFSQDHNRHVDLLGFACFVRENYTSETKMEEATINQSAQVVSKGVDIWKDDKASTRTNDSVVAKLRDHFCSCYLPFVSNSQFVEAGVKEARIVSTTGRNGQLRSDYAICPSFLFGKLKPLSNTPARVHQILTMIIQQNSVHQNEVTKLVRRERRKVVTSALLRNHYQKKEVGEEPEERL